MPCTQIVDIYRALLLGSPNIHLTEFKYLSTFPGGKIQLDVMVFPR